MRPKERSRFLCVETAEERFGGEGLAGHFAFMRRLLWAGWLGSNAGMSVQRDDEGKVRQQLVAQHLAS